MKINRFVDARTGRSVLPDAGQAETDGGGANMWDSRLGGLFRRGFEMRAEAKKIIKVRSIEESGLTFFSVGKGVGACRGRSQPR